MPAGISTLANFHSNKLMLPSTAFTILQKDGLDRSSLPLLHLDEYDDDTRKSGTITKSNPLIKTQSKSHDNLTNNYDKLHFQGEKIDGRVTLSTDNFNQILSAKLLKIQARILDFEREKKLESAHRTKDERKPFVTVVKTGEFLLPPPEVAALLGMTPSYVLNNNFETASYNNNNNNNNNNTIDVPISRSKLKPLLSLTSKRPEIRYTSHNARCPHSALKATVDYSLGPIRSIVGRTSDDLKKTNTTWPSPKPRALPKKLKPIEGTTIFRISYPCDQPVPFRNIMFDRRVVRGNTHANATLLMDGEQSIAARQAEARRRQLIRKRAETLATRALCLRAGSPPPMPGRKHEPVQTDKFLEELLEKPDEMEIGTQTDLYLDRPPTPKFYPIKTGKDACTQIQPGELFDYDSEVEPILEILVGKTIEQALIEVLEEEELAALREQQRRFHELRAAEKAEIVRLQEQDRRLKDEKEWRTKQYQIAIKEQEENEERVAAAVLLTGYIAELLPAVLEGLKMSGFLLDEMKADVEEGFMPWLMHEVKKETGTMIESKELLMEIIREILENRAKTYQQLGEEYVVSRMLESSIKSESQSSSEVEEEEEGEQEDD